MTQPANPGATEGNTGKAQFSAEQETALIDIVKKALSGWQADETSRRTQAEKDNPAPKNFWQQLFSDGD